MKNTLQPQLQLPTGTWVLDTSATTVTITARKLLAFTVPATLTVTSGSIEIADGGAVSVDVVADASSYASKNAKRNEHIVGPDFLDAANHPAIRFQAHDVAWSATGGTATFDASARIDRADLGVGKLPSLIIGPKLDLTVSTAASRTD